MTLKNVAEMSNVIDEAKGELLRLSKREHDLETVIELSRAALLDDTAASDKRIDTALRFLRMEHVL
ncbi:MAG TPA: hypothetical protein VGH62_11880 [Bradyrhizobium sp.]|jgi:hypothetical protein